MRLGSVGAADGAFIVAATAWGWFDLRQVFGAVDPRAREMRTLISAWPQVQGEIAAALELAESGAAGRLTPATEELLLPPVPDPGRIICIGQNYAEHLREQGETELPKAPEVFLRLQSTLVGPRGDIWLPEGVPEVDLEAELAVVVGRGGRRIPREAALDAAFGWTVFNDVSVRSFQFRGTQWTPGNNFDATAPCGPYIMTRDELPDVGNLTIYSAIDGQEMQRSSTADMIFDIATLIADVSRFTTLEPGDLIATGTPPGVGLGRRPPRWLRPGEVVRCGVDGVGELQNRCVVR